MGKEIAWACSPRSPLFESLVSCKMQVVCLEIVVLNNFINIFKRVSDQSDQQQGPVPQLSSLQVKFACLQISIKQTGLWPLAAESMRVDFTNLQYAELSNWFIVRKIMSKNQYFTSETFSFAFLFSLAVLHYMSQYSFCWDAVGMDIKDLESVGMDPNRSAPLRASTSPPPPLAYFQHIKLSVPKRKA